MADNGPSWLPGPGSHNRPARVRQSHQLGGQKQSGGCCSIAAAGRAARHGRYRLAARYVRMTPRYLARRFA